ncbi:hypothetical protein M0804_011604 [Polistes exclamans]|nr:hypothetical protein M0804_011604 [Polistes exclamans]
MVASEAAESLCAYLIGSSIFFVVRITIDVVSCKLKRVLTQTRGRQHHGPWLAKLLLESRSGSLREGKEGSRSRGGSAGAGAREALSAAKRNLESQKVVRRGGLLLLPRLPPLPPSSPLAFILPPPKTKSRVVTAPAPAPPAAAPAPPVMAAVVAATPATLPPSTTRG